MCFEPRGMLTKRFGPIWMYIERFYENEKIEFFRILDHFWSPTIVWDLRFPHGKKKIKIKFEFENLDKLDGRFPIWADTLVSFSLPFLRKWQKSSKWSYAFNEIKIWRARCAPKYSDNMHENWLENMILSIFHNFQESKSRVQMRALKIFCYEFILLTLLKVPKFWMNRIFQKLTIKFEFENLLFSKKLKILKFENERVYL